MELTYSISKKDYMDFNLQRLNKHYAIRFAAIVAGIYLLVMLLLAAFSGFSAINWWVTFIGAVVLFFFGLWIYRFNYKRATSKAIARVKDNIFDAENKIIQTNNGLEIISQNRKSEILYSEIDNILSNDKFIWIKFKAGDLIFVPRHSIRNPERVDDFTKDLRSKI